MRPNLVAAVSLFAVSLPAQSAAESRATDLRPPVALTAAGAPIEIGALSNIAHAGPALGDVDGDGDHDLLVGDFPGYFWVFENRGTEEAPVYAAGKKLKAGGADAKVPVY
jgi:hypothetical protein